MSDGWASGGGLFHGPPPPCEEVDTADTGTSDTGGIPTLSGGGGCAHVQGPGPFLLALTAWLLTRTRRR
ncbi:MAG: hypothetical protein KC656_24115 [Myxococcales bacterium]|nr:hypothetical protein [Myxococcales bacterium]MCB9670916.1 hypothetical protein [Alphaproteobacteria bacterium]